MASLQRIASAKQGIRGHPSRDVDGDATDEWGIRLARSWIGWIYQRTHEPPMRRPNRNLGRSAPWFFIVWLC